MHVIGIDPAIARVGLAHVFREKRAIVCGFARTLDLTKFPLRERVAAFGDELARVFAAFRSFGVTIALCSLENQRNAQVAQAKRGHFTNKTSAVNEVVGAALNACRSAGIEVIELQPVTWRASLGLPRYAEKEQVKEWLRRVVKGVPRRFSEHAGDALGNAVAGLQRAPSIIRERERSRRRIEHVG